MQVIQASISFLGRIVSEKGYNIDPKPTEAVILLKSKIPRTVGEVRRVIGLLGVYRRHIRENGQLPSNHPIQWSIKDQTALNTLIDCVTSLPILAYPNYSSVPRMGWEPCYISVKAERSRVIAYASRTLTQAEKNYHLHAGKLEFLALKWVSANNSGIIYIMHHPS